MRKLTNIPWSQLAVEAVAIVLSILLAFWIDAWWEIRQEQQTERRYLQAISGDIDAILKEADRTSIGNAELNDKARRRMAALTAGDQLSDAVIGSILLETNVSYRLRASLDTYTDLLSSGNILTLSDHQVRASLAKLRTVMDFEQEVFRWVVEFGHGITSTLHESISERSIDEIVRLESQVIMVRENHIRRKSEVIEAGKVAQAAIATALARP